jgi:DNA-binding response OmpR family regulator
MALLYVLDKETRLDLWMSIGYFKEPNWNIRRGSQPGRRVRAPDVPEIQMTPVRTTLPGLVVRPKITVVDDDHVMRNMLVEYLDQNGMQATPVADHLGLVQQLKQEPSLIILDLHLGQEDGLDLLRHIRATSDVPVIVVTGHRREEIDRVLGLELGADDYLTKPFGLRELLARMRTILRRRTVGGEAARPRKGQRIRFGPWELDRVTRQIQRGDEAPVALTKNEYALLHAFLDAPNRPLSREHLLRATRVHDDVFDRSIDVQILRLRRKLENDPAIPQIIETLRGVGYVFRAQMEA